MLAEAKSRWLRVSMPYSDNGKGQLFMPKKGMKEAIVQLMSESRSINQVSKQAGLDYGTSSNYARKQQEP